MTIGRRRVLCISFLFFAALAVVLVLKEVVAPRLVRRRLITEVQDNCKTCELSLGRVQISLLPPALSSRHVRFTGGEQNATVVSVEAERVYLPFSLLPLFKNHLRAGRIEVEQPVVKVKEGDLYASSSAKDSAARPHDLEIEGIEMKKASFVYVREYPGRAGSISVSRINAAVGPIGSSDRLRAADVEANADGLLEESGRFHLQVRAKVFAKVPDVDVKLQIAGQELAGMNKFFKANDGLELHGLLIEGRGSSEIRGARLKSSAYVRYRGLGVKLKKNKERSALSAFFQNLLVSITSRKQNVKGGDYDRSGTVELERKTKETIISFALRGMKEAAIKVTSQGEKKKRKK